MARGPLVGGQVGINKQLGSFVFGLELDGSWADIKGSSSFQVAAGGLAVDAARTSKIDSLATFAGRAGIAADRWFVFAKAGISAVHEKHTTVSNLSGLVGGVPATQTTAVSGSETRYAPMLGFGAEYALVGPWSILAEYDYHHLGVRNVRQTGTVTFFGVATPAVADSRIEQAIHVAKLGVNYRFGNVAPDPSFAPVPPASGTDWTGAYIGAQGGYGWGQTQWPDLFGAVQPSGSLPRFENSGWLAGGTIGVNAQSGRFVFGVEGEILATGIKGNFSSSAPVFGAPGAVINSTFSSKIDWLALASARAGFVVGDRLMLYGKGGLAIAQEEHSARSDAEHRRDFDRCVRQGRSHRRGRRRGRRICLRAELVGQGRIRLHQDVRATGPAHRPRVGRPLWRRHDGCHDGQPGYPGPAPREVRRELPFQFAAGRSRALLSVETNRHRRA